jgi:hypothetical protein
MHQVKRPGLPRGTSHRSLSPSYSHSPASTAQHSPDTPPAPSPSEGPDAHPTPSHNPLPLSVVVDPAGFSDPSHPSGFLADGGAGAPTPSPHHTSPGRHVGGKGGPAGAGAGAGASPHARALAARSAQSVIVASRGLEAFKSVRRGGGVGTARTGSGLRPGSPRVGSPLGTPGARGGTGEDAMTLPGSVRTPYAHTAHVLTRHARTLTHTHTLHARHGGHALRHTCAHATHAHVLTRHAHVHTRHARTPQRPTPALTPPTHSLALVVRLELERALTAPMPAGALIDVLCWCCCLPLCPVWSVPWLRGLPRLPRVPCLTRQRGWHGPSLPPQLPPQPLSLG